MVFNTIKSARFIIMVLTLCFSIVAQAGYTIIKVGSLYYKIDGQCAMVTSDVAGISSYDAYKGTIRIPSSVSYGGKAYPVTSIDDRTFASSVEIDTLEIPNSVERIGKFALNYSGINKLIIGSGLKEFGEGAFSTAYFEEIVIHPDNKYLVIKNHVLCTSNLERAMALVFSRETNPNVYIPSGVKHIDDNFAGARRLETLHIPNGVEYIGDAAFTHALENTNTQRELYLPNSCTHIGKDAFYQCIRMEKIHLPEGLTRLEPYSFAYCSPEYINLPKTLKVICDGALACTSGGAYKNLVLPEGLDSIGRYGITCIHCDSLIIPESLRYLSENSLDNFSSYIEIRAQLDSIPTKAIPSQGVKKLVLPKSLKRLCAWAFYPCYSLTEVVWPDNLEFIGRAALAGIKADPVEIPATVKTLDYMSLATNVWEPRRFCFYSKEPPVCLSPLVFDGINYAQSTLYVQKGCKKAYANKEPWNWFGTIEEIDGPWIKPTPALCYDFEKDGLYYNVLSEEEGLCELTCNFKDHISIYKGNITVPGLVENSGKTYKVIKIANNAFIDSKVQKVILPEEIEIIGENAFSRCSNLVSISMPNNLSQMGRGAFSSCDLLKSIDIPNGISAIPDGAFAWCLSLTSIKIPSNISHIGEYAFGECKNLQHVQVTNNLTSIGNGAFGYCTSLASFTFPRYLQIIYGDAFAGCTSLMNVYSMTTTPPVLEGYNQFELSKIAKLHVIDGYRDVYYNESRWKYYFDIVADINPAAHISVPYQNETSETLYDLTGRKITNIPIKRPYIKGNKLYNNK